ncbi:hypothetical protein CLOM_g18262 [Closterium sp. NIES-68]|nr:hypothetical protein CLOM_g18262 [Closterium sp. NIES-68]
MEAAAGTEASSLERQIMEQEKLGDGRFHDHFRGNLPPPLVTQSPSLPNPTPPQVPSPPGNSSTNTRNPRAKIMSQGSGNFRAAGAGKVES